jgi:hypothetical protein
LSRPDPTAATQVIDPAMPTEPNLEASTNLLSTIIKNLGLLGAALYFGGWVYLNRYYSQFDIDITLLELSWYDIVVHSAALLTNGMQLLLRWPLVALLIAALFAFRFLEHHHAVFSSLLEQLGLRDSQFLLPMTISFLALTSTLLAAQYVGAAQARRDWIAVREPLFFGFKDPHCLKDPFLEYANHELQLRLLKSTSKWHFVVVQNASQAQKRPLPIRVFHIPTACVASARRDVSPR